MSEKMKRVRICRDPIDENEYRGYLHSCGTGNLTKEELDSHLAICTVFPPQKETRPSVDCSFHSHIKCAGEDCSCECHSLVLAYRDKVVEVIEGLTCFCETFRRMLIDAGRTIVSLPEYQCQRCQALSAIKEVEV